MAAKARTAPIRSQEPGASSGSPMGAGTQGLGPSSTSFPGHSGELDRKWSSRDSNQGPYGMPALQVVALPTMPLHRPLPICFLSFFFFLRFIYLFERVTQREERSSVQCGARSFFLQGTKDLGHLLLLSQAIAESWIGRGEAGTRTSAHMELFAERGCSGARCRGPAGGAVCLRMRPVPAASRGLRRSARPPRDPLRTSLESALCEQRIQQSPRVPGRSPEPHTFRVSSHGSGPRLLRRHWVSRKCVSAPGSTVHRKRLVGAQCVLAGASWRCPFDGSESPLETEPPSLTCSSSCPVLMSQLPDVTPAVSSCFPGCCSRSPAARPTAVRTEEVGRAILLLACIAVFQAPRRNIWHIVQKVPAESSTAGVGRGRE
nr:uncharacterized protein LOC108176054 [Oryctolagus cuniculus]